MKIGVSLFLTENTGEPGAIAREAEHLGFESFWVAEHLVIPVYYTTYYPRGVDGKIPDFYAHLADPFVALAMAAQATTRIRLGTAICLLPERDTITTAKAAATLDMYSNGRLMLGIGAGWFPEEAEIMGVQFARRWQHLRESVEALRELWSKDEASYQGEFVKFPAVKLFPKPVQKPYLPIFLGIHNPKYAPKRVARYGDGWCPGGALTPEQAREVLPEVRRLTREAGRDPDRLEFSVLLRYQEDGPTLETMQQYQEAGVSRLVLYDLATASSSGIEVVRKLAHVVERAQKV